MRTLLLSFYTGELKAYTIAVGFGMRKSEITGNLSLWNGENHLTFPGFCCVITLNSDCGLCVMSKLSWSSREMEIMYQFSLTMAVY